jgi:hypothetical protein
MRSRRVRTMRFGSIAAMVVGVSMWMLPAWGQSGSLPPEFQPASPPRAAQPASSPQAAQAAAMTDMGMGSASDPEAALTQQLAGARLATAKYATNLARAKADGYQVITPMMPNMGIHFMNPDIAGFNIRKPQILVYEHHGSTWQLGALEWVFLKMPKTPPLQNATFGLFPAACHYKDGTFIPDQNSRTCRKTNPKTGAKFTFWHPDLTTMHVWIWYPNPAGLYSSTNPLVAPFNGG